MVISGRGDLCEVAEEDGWQACGAATLAEVSTRLYPALCKALYPCHLREESTAWSPETLLMTGTPR